MAKKVTTKKVAKKRVRKNVDRGQAHSHLLTIQSLH